MKRIFATAIFVCLLLATPAWARYEEAKAAYERGDYRKAAAQGTQVLSMLTPSK